MDRLDLGGLNDYQLYAKETAIYPEQGHIIGLLYASLGLANEAGEVAGKVKKIIRDDYLEITAEKIEEIKKELGDTLWYLSQVAMELGLDLSDIAQSNLDKLYSRKERGTLGGSGDER